MVREIAFSYRLRTSCRPSSLPKSLWKPIVVLLGLGALLTGGTSTPAQNAQQEYVYASVPVTTATSEVVGFLTNGQGVPGSPLTDALEGGLVAIDALGRFVFVINPVSSKVSMFEITQATGMLTEVPGSPFAVGATENPSVTPSAPVCLATEKSGKFLYVGYRNGNFAGESAIVEYQINLETPGLIVPTTAAGVTDIPFPPIGMVSDEPERLFVGLGSNGTSGEQGEGTSVYSIDVSGGTGELTLVGTAGSGNAERSIAIDPQGRFFFDGWGSAEGFIESALIAVDGTANTIVSTISLPEPGDFPSAMLADGSGKFLYVQEPGGAAVYSIDSSGALTPTLASTSVLSFQRGTAAADPQSPYIYSLQNDGIHTFEIDPEFGGLSDRGAPFSVAPGMGIDGLAVSGAPGVQASSGPMAQLSPSTVNFGSVGVGQSSSPQTVSLMNTGSQPLVFSSLAIGGTNLGDFAATPTSSCQPPTTLPAKAACSISVVFTPTVTGVRQATLTVGDNAVGGSQSAVLSGTGVGAGPGVTPTPNSLSFAALSLGSASTAQTVMLTNSGIATLHISSVVLSGADVSDFSIASNKCAGAIQVNANCLIGVTFSPVASGMRTASLSITDDAPGSPQSVQLSGTGVAAASAVTLTPSSLSFASTNVGSSSAAQTVLLTNSGTMTLHISSVVLSGVDASDFNISSNNCSGAIQQSANCLIGVIFSPVASGVRTASLSITDDAPGSPQSVPLSGTGAAATSGVTVTPASLSFASTNVGASTVLTAVLTSSGSAALHISSVVLSGADVSDFSIASNNCSGAVAVNGSCSIGVTFAPVTDGRRTASLLIMDDAPGSPQAVQLTGTGTGNVTPVTNPSSSAPGAFTVSGIQPATGSVTVSAGQTATYSVMLLPNFTGTISAGNSACTGAPTGAVCSATPGPLQVTSGTAATLTINITTTGAGALAPLREIGRFPFSEERKTLRLMFVVVFVLLAICVGFGCGFADERLGRAMGLAGCVLVVAVCVAGCGGGGVSAQSAPVTQATTTPAGTYTIVVAPVATASNGQSAGATPTISLTLVVE
jgi:hypothetical protein